LIITGKKESIVMEFLTLERIFPMLMIVLSVAASAVYFTKGSPAMGCYWISAASLTTTTLFM